MQRKRRIGLKRTVTLILFFILIINFIAPHIVALGTGDGNPFAEYDKYRRAVIEGANGARYAPKASTAPFSDSSNRYIVVFKSDVSLKTVYKCVNNYSFRLLSDSSQRVFSLNIDDISTFNQLYSKIVLTIDKDEKRTLSASVDDPLSEYQWELNALDMYSAWDLYLYNNPVTVAILDSGIYRLHEEFEGLNILAGYDAVTDATGVTFDANGHGTKVTSIIAGTSNNGKGMAGIARNLTILPIRVSDSTGYVYSTDFIEAVYFAADAGAKVINMSFGGYVYSAAEETAVEYAVNKGAILVASAGNEATDTRYAGMKSYPASYNSVISVGAMDAAGNVCDFSQYNDSVDLIAPGIGLTVADGDGSYCTEQGTSFSAAYISAVISAALSTIDEGFTFTADQFLSLVATLNGNDRDNKRGYGSINAKTVIENINRPLYSGVENGGVYHKNITVSFNRGSATLDGNAFVSGDSVIYSGRHKINFFDETYNEIIEFVTDNIPLKYEFKESSNSSSIVFTRGTATLDGVPYISGTPIKTDGKHFFIITGPYGNSETYEFEVYHNAPEIFGAANGHTYDSPIYVRVANNATLSVNGVNVGTETVLSTNGTHTLVAEREGKKKTIRVTVRIADLTVYDSTVASAKIAVDEEYDRVYLYNANLSGIRTYAKNAINKTLSFIRTKESIINHFTVKDSFVFVHNGGISVCPRSALASGDATKIRYYHFRDGGKSATCYAGYVYYVVANNSKCDVIRLNIDNGKEELMNTIKEDISALLSSQELILITSDGQALFADSTASVARRINIGVQPKSLYACDGYFCFNNTVYLADNGTPLFSLGEEETVLLIKNNVLITDCAVYSTSTGNKLGVFETAITDCEITANFAYKCLSTLKIETIALSQGFDKTTAISALNAADTTHISVGPIVNSSEFVLSVELPSDITVDKAVMCADGKSICAASFNAKTLYYFDCATMSLVSSRHLRYTPSDICSDSGGIFICFENQPYIFSHKGISDNGTYQKTSRPYTKLKAEKGTLVALTADGDLFAYSTAHIDMAPQTVIRSQAVTSFDINSGYVYAYLKPSIISMLYKISVEDGAVAAAAPINSVAGELISNESYLTIGRDVYDASDLSLVDSVDGAVIYADDKYLLTETALYSASTREPIGKHRYVTSNCIFDAYYNYYSFNDLCFYKVSSLSGDLSTLPKVNGVSNNAVYKTGIIPTFDYGVGYIDGVLYNKGDVIEIGGYHSFTLAMPFGVSAVYSFDIEAKINSITLSLAKKDLFINETTSCTIKAYPAVNAVVNALYSTSNDNAIVYEDGTVIGVSAGECVITARTSDGACVSSVTITIKDSALIFDSSYFNDSNGNGIVTDIPPGTSIDVLYSAVSSTHGMPFVTSPQGTQISEGIIATDMIVSLNDINGNTIDNRILSVVADVDCDGYIGANDYYCLEKEYVQPDSMSQAKKAAADIDGNGTINVFDLLLLKEHLLGIRPLVDVNAIPERTARAKAYITMPYSLSPNTGFTLGITLDESQNVSAISGRIEFSSLAFAVKDVSFTGGNGYYYEEEGTLRFFADCNQSHPTETIVLISFHTAIDIDESSNLGIKLSGIQLHDGGASNCGSVAMKAAYSAKAVPSLIIHNLPNFSFDSEQHEYTLTFPPYSSNVYVSVYPENSFAVIGSTRFADGLAEFNAIYNGNSDMQYSFACTAEMSVTDSDGNDEQFKSSNSNLASITVEGGTLSPEFSQNVKKYIVVTPDSSRLRFNAVPEHEGATVTVGEYDSESNSISITCVAEDGSVNFYTLIIKHGTPVDRDYIPKQASLLWLWILLGIAVLSTLAVLSYYHIRRFRK